MRTKTLVRLKRLPVIRHVRWAWCAFWCYRWAAEWARAGVGLGVPNDWDLRQLDRIWRGDR